ncbi:hypothetical protein [sulfur-oxidizing endosymbiont of Gigantopelta aegis]|uniref:hypothetical protein n=1 Tax=sulfur-oxidizing endosymbiont of Gigantopelta aegis TaxID=2794934 RepID=UPI0018DBE801|nr:hypothetical protein [sulfur-oxidizing endosymbiont of Gigantopelta aegis]
MKLKIKRFRAKSVDFRGASIYGFKRGFKRVLKERAPLWHYSEAPQKVRNFLGLR